MPQAAQAKAALEGAERAHPLSQLALPGGSTLLAPPAAHHCGFGMDSSFPTAWQHAVQSYPALQDLCILVPCKEQI